MLLITRPLTRRASQISDHHEKQKFLKALYENFYKAYNPKAADRLGVIYTPDEIVRFMIESADHLVFKHFGKTLGDRGVEILDPATGTGTFITELIEYLPPAQLEYKYAHEIHCNEVAILPYYIANLNIEFTYKQKTGKYREFEHICFVDTLDNMGFVHTGQQLNFFGIGDENAARITEQNARKISVAIGNPPYSAWQENYNNQNANRAYPDIDNRLKDTYIKHGTAQNQIGVYDMYTRFYRWASDRLDKTGVIVFITNSSYLDSRAFDGFRKVVASEFSHIYIIDLGGNIRNNPKLSGTTHNVFGIQTGVAIAFMVKSEKKGKTSAQIFYARRPEFELATEKLEFLRSTKFADLKFEHIQPDAKHNWLHITHNDWDDLLPLVGETKAIFSLYSNGIKTQRDGWVYDFSKSVLGSKMLFFTEVYNSTLADDNNPDKLKIKWDPDLESYKVRGFSLNFDEEKIIRSIYRPFVRMYLYFDKRVIGRSYQMQNIFPNNRTENLAIWWKTGADRPQFALAVNSISDGLPEGGSICFPLYHYGEGERLENITDWALGQFQKHYKDKTIAKDNIFHYVYAVLHHPSYRKKYEQNLKREFPRIPFYEDFWKWAEWGHRLMDLHLNYETIEPWPLERLDPSSPKSGMVSSDLGEVAGGRRGSCRLIARKDTGIIEVDTLTSLPRRPLCRLGIPPRHLLRPRMGARTLQGKETQRSDDCGEVQYL